MATKIMMPKLSDTMEEGVILKWLRKEGEKIKQGEILVEIESDKADMELEAYDSGIVRKIVVPEGGKAKIGALIAVIGEADEDIGSLLAESPSTQPSARKQAEAPQQAARQAGAPAASIPPSPLTQPTDGTVKASPLAKRIAQERGINLSGVRGTGPSGRVIKRDLEGAAAGGVGPRPTGPPPPRTSGGGPPS